MGKPHNKTTSSRKMLSRELQDKAYALKLRELSYSEIAKAQECSRSTAFKRVAKAAARIAKENAGDIRRIKAEEDQRTREGIRKVLLLEGRAQTVTVQCKCGEDVTFTVPALTPGDIQAGRKVVLEHSKEIRKIHGVDATKKIMIESEVKAGTEATVGSFMTWMRDADEEKSHVPWMLEELAKWQEHLEKAT